MELILESILQETKNYKGFRYLTKEDMESSFDGTTIGIDQTKQEKDWFVDTDHSRVVYF